MIAYQVLSERDQLIAAYAQLEKVVYATHDFTQSNERHHYHAEELELEVV